MILIDRSDQRVDQTPAPTREALKRLRLIRKEVGFKALETSPDISLVILIQENEAV